MNIWYTESPAGLLCLEEENDALTGLHFVPGGAPELEPLPRKVRQTPLLAEAEQQLGEYFAGVRREFDLPLSPRGTVFQKAVWGQLLAIPTGNGGPTVSWPPPSASQRPAGRWAGPATETPSPS